MELSLTLTSIPALTLLATWFVLGVYVKTNVPSEIFPPVFRRVTLKAAGFVIAPATILVGIIFLAATAQYGGTFSRVFIVLYAALMVAQFGLTVASVMSINEEILEVLDEVGEHAVGDHATV